MIPRFLAMLWLMSVTVAVSIATATPTLQVRQQIEEKLRNLLVSDRYDYVVEITSLASSLPEVYDSLTIQILGDGKPFGNCWLRVFFFEGTRAVHTANVGAKVYWFQDVLVATETIKRGDPLSDELFIPVRQEVKTLVDPPVVAGERLLGLEAARTLRQGAVLTQSYIRTEQVVKRGDRVKIRYATGGLVVTSTGEARQAGSVGDLIKVRNLSTNKTILAEVQDENSVRIIR